MPGFDDEVVARRRLRRTQAQGEALSAPDPAELRVRTVQWVYVEGAPGTWYQGDPYAAAGDPQANDYFSVGAEWLALPGPLLTTLSGLADADPGEHECWAGCGEVVGWAEHTGEGPHGEEIDGITWRPVSLVFEAGLPVNLLCEAHAPMEVERRPAPVATTARPAAGSALARLLRVVADGREEYAQGAPAKSADTLETEAASFRSAAILADGDVSVLWRLLPSWRETPEVQALAAEAAAEVAGRRARGEISGG